MDSSQDGMKIFSGYRARVNATIKRASLNAPTEVCTLRIIAVLLQYFPEDTDGRSAGPAARRLRTANRPPPTERNEHKAVGWGGMAKKQRGRERKKMATGYVTGGGNSQ